MEFQKGLLLKLQELSQSFGSGDPKADVILLVVIAMVVIALFMTVKILRRSGATGGSSRDTRSTRNTGMTDSFDRLSGIAGKLERLEMNTNAFRTEVARNQEFLKAELGELDARLRRLESDGGEILPPKVETPTHDEPTGSQTATHDSRAVRPQEPARETRDDIEPREPNFELDAEETVSIDRTSEPPQSVDLTEPPSKPSHKEEPLTQSKPKKGSTLLSGLTKTRRGLFERIRGVFSSKPKLDADMLEELEALLVSADLGVKLVSDLISELKENLQSGMEVNEQVLLRFLKKSIRERLAQNAPPEAAIQPARRSDGPLVVMMVGVNGVGKTTTTAKLAHQWTQSGAKVLMVAADTFRAAAVQQLCEWGSRIGVPVVFGAENAKPATVVFDAMKRAHDESFDVVLIDTAGRLHTKSNLMQELEGVRNIVQKHQPLAPHESILVLDGTTGQNAVNQAREFHQAISLTGLVVTKLDGTPKGGIVVAVKDELGIPVRYVGVGEGTEDLKVFSPADFADALLDSSEPSAAVGSAAEPSAHAQKRRRRRRDTVGHISADS